MISKFLFFFFIIILSIKISFSNNIYKLKCKNVDDNTVHFFLIHKNYKIINILQMDMNLIIFLNKGK